MAKFIGMQEAADTLNVSYKTIQRYVNAGKLKSKKESGQRLVSIDSLKKVAEQNNPDKPETAEIKAKNALPHSDLVSSFVKSKDQEIEFLRDVVKTQQKQISDQNERITEIDHLILNTQSQLAQLNKTLQLYAGDKKNEDSVGNDLAPEKNLNAEEKIDKTTPPDLAKIFDSPTQSKNISLWIVIGILGLLLFLAVVYLLSVYLQS